MSQKQFKTLISGFIFGSLFFQSSFCAGQQAQRNPQNQNSNLTPKKISLKEDQKTLEQLREKIPPQTRKENDELFFILNLFEDLNRDPRTIRRQFDQFVRKKRNAKNSEFKKERKKFQKQIKDKRKAFLKKMKEDRKVFLATKPSRERRKDFFNEHRTQRASFFAEIRDKQKNFQSEMKDKQNNLKASVEEIRTKFQNMYKSFKKRRAEMKRSTAAQKKYRNKNPEPLLPEYQKYLEDLRNAPKKPTAPTLKPGE